MREGRAHIVSGIPVIQRPCPSEHLRYLEKESERQQRFGEVRPIIHADYKGKKIVAVGNQVCTGDWKFFPDFLRSYLPAVLTPEWGRAETAKPLEDRHPIMKWWDAMGRFLSNQKPNKDGVLEFQPNGAMTACMLLAYDLYTLRHHSSLQSVVVDRLKHHEQFQGARYELFVAATSIRAGCDLTYENERDRSQKHVEFRATHRATGLVFSVEAKSRHDAKEKSSSRLRVGKLINTALSKPTTLPLVVFVDVNAPPEQGSPFGRRWFKAVLRSLDSSGAVASESDRFNLIVFTNHPFCSDAQGAVPRPEVTSMFGKNPTHPIDRSVLEAIHIAAEKFGNVPMQFPCD